MLYKLTYQNPTDDISTKFCSIHEIDSYKNQINDSIGLCTDSVLTNRFRAYMDDFKLINFEVVDLKHNPEEAFVRKYFYMNYHDYMVYNHKKFFGTTYCESFYLFLYFSDSYKILIGDTESLRDKFVVPGHLKDKDYFKWMVSRDLYETIEFQNTVYYNLETLNSVGDIEFIDDYDLQRTMLSIDEYRYYDHW